MGKTKFRDCCQHGEGYFVGTIKRWEKGQRYKNYDVYVFPSDFYGHEVCIRYGSKPEQYISPGDIIAISKHCNDGLCDDVLNLIRDKGRFVFDFKKE